MADRSRTESQSQPAPGDQAAGAEHPVPGGPDRGSEARFGRLAPTKGVVEGIRCRPERVVDRLVADAAAATRRESRRGRLEHPVQGPGVQLLRAAGCHSGLDQGRAVERAGCAAGRCRQDVAGAPNERTRGGRCVGLFHCLADRPKSEGEIVAVVAVTQHGIEPGQVGLVTLDGRRASDERRSDVAAGNGWHGTPHALGAGGSRPGCRSSVGGGPDADNVRDRHRSASIATIDVLLMASCRARRQAGSGNPGRSWW